VAAAASPTLLIAVPPFPADLDYVRPSTPATEPGPHDHVDAPPDDDPAASVAEAWVVAIYTGRFDDAPGDAARFIAPLAANAAVADAAIAALPRLSRSAGEVRWPVIVTVLDAGDGWWELSGAVKTTRFGQVGPATTELAARVHVNAALFVDDWEVVG
jgi:hypothetical protein